MNCFPSDQKKINYVDYNMFKILDKSDTNNYVRITNKGSNCTDSSFIPVYSINNYILNEQPDVIKCIKTLVSQNSKVNIGVYKLISK